MTTKQHLLLAAAILIITACITSINASGTWETSNDPDGLCVAGFTGYKATKDCRGYVYCNDGYLMGGGVIPCWPNQLFDATQNACTYWQDVDTSGNKCPDFDGTMMMPDQADPNANEERFFCGHSWSTARSQCIPCPGGTRAECPDKTHQCFAGVTGCPTTSSSSSTTNTAASSNNIISSNPQPAPPVPAPYSPPVVVVKPPPPPPPPPAVTVIQSFPNPTPPIAPPPIVTATVPSPPTTASFTTNNNSNNNNQCTSDTQCPSSQFCHNGYCSQCTHEGRGCTVDQVCRTASCHVTQKAGPSKCYDKSELHQFCKVAWKNEAYVCNLDKMICEMGSSSSSSGETSQTTSSISSPSSVGNTNNVSNNSSNNGSALGTTTTTNTNTIITPLYTNPTNNEYFCGATFSSTTLNCLQSKPCPNGFSTGYCGSTEGCFKVSQCRLEYAAAAAAATTTSLSSPATNAQQTVSVVTTASQPQSPPPPSPFIVVSPPTPTTPSATVSNNSSNNNNDNECKSHSDCPTNQFCNDYGHTGYCGECSHVLGIGCSVDEVCRTAGCHVTQTPGPGRCYNKMEMHSFCQVAWKDDSYMCNLEKMVCERSSTTSVVPISTPPPPSPPATTTTTTPKPSSKQPTPLPTVPQTPNPTKAPTINEYFCGKTWQEHIDDCENAVPCPRGDECDAGYTCFAGSPCASSKGQGGGSNNNNPVATAPTTTSTTTTATKATIVAATTTTTTTTKMPAKENAQQNPIGSISVLNENEEHSSDDSQTVEVTNDITLKHCDICDGAGQLDWSETVMFEGKSISCGEFGWIFGSKNILDGSDKCLEYRSSYFGQCCFVPPSNGCSLCDGKGGEWYDINLVATTTYDGESEVSCTQLSNKISRKIESSSTQCTEAKNDHFDTCCFQKCSICGDLQMDWEATIFYKGSEVSCHQLEGKEFYEKGIDMTSDTCVTSQELYKSACCIDPPQNPCNLCRSGDNEFRLKSEVNVVSATGETETCLEVFQTLLSRREQSSQQCLSAQNELQSKCCDRSYDYNAPVPTPAINWSPSAMDEPAGYPHDGFYYTKPDWNENWNGSGRNRIESTVKVFLLGMVAWILV